MLHEFDIYPSRPNSVRLALTTKGQDLPDHRALTRLVVYVESRLFDSQSQPTLFDLAKKDYLEIKLGAVSPALAIGRHACMLVVYDAGEYAGGWVWPEKFVVNVRSEPS